MSARWLDWGLGATFERFSIYAWLDAMASPYSPRAVFG